MAARKFLIAIALVSIVLIVGAFVAAVGVPNLVGSGQIQAEKAAVATLRSLHWAQGIFRRNAYLDADENGEGEFGTLRQLAAVDPLPSGETIPAPLTSMAGSRLEGDVLAAGAFCFRLDLPESTYDRERSFVAWGWPIDEGLGTRRYCIDQDEQIWEAPAGAHVGCENEPPPAPCPPDESFVRWRGKTNVRSVGADP